MQNRQLCIIRLLMASLAPKTVYAPQQGQKPKVFFRNDLILYYDLALSGFVSTEPFFRAKREFLLFSTMLKLRGRK